MHQAASPFTVSFHTNPFFSILGSAGMHFSISPNTDSLSRLIANHGQEPGAVNTLHPLQCTKSTQIGTKVHAVKVGTVEGKLANSGKLDSSVLADGLKELERIKVERDVSRSEMN